MKQCIKKQIRKCVILKCGRKKIFNIDPEKVFNLREQGCTSFEIAEFFGVDHGYIIAVWSKIYKEKGLKAPVNQDCLKVSTEKLVELKKIGLSYSEILGFLQSENLSISSKSILSRLKKYYEKTGENVTKIKKDNLFNSDKIDFKHIDKETLKNIMCYIKNTRNATDEQIYELYKCYGIELDDVIEAQVVDEKDFEDR